MPYQARTLASYHFACSSCAQRGKCLMSWGWQMHLSLSRNDRSVHKACALQSMTASMSVGGCDRPPATGLCQGLRTSDGSKGSFCYMPAVMVSGDDCCCRYARLDGSTNRVQRMIDIAQFQAPGSKTFIYILNTRAGGLGVNLHTADTCILFDSDWNPQVRPTPIWHIYYIL